MPKEQRQHPAAWQDLGLAEEVAMSDKTAKQMPETPDPATIAEIIHGLEPMGDPSKFSIEDLTPEEEDAFFTVIDNL